MNELTQKQKAVLDFVKRTLKAGEPFPSLSEIGDHFGFSKNTAKVHLHALEKKGAIKRREQRVSDFLLAQDTPASHQFEVVARISAGIPDEAFEESQLIELDQRFFGGGELKLLEVNGDSMLGDSICDGDLAVIKLQKSIRPQDIAAVRVEGEGLTLKRLRKKGAQIELLPSNPDFKPQSFPASHIEVLGKLVGIVRKSGL